MPALDQPKTTYSDLTPHRRVIGDMIHLIDPTDAPVVMKLGLDSARSKFALNLNGTKIEILEDEYAATSDVAAQGTTITSTTLSITVTDASKFQDGSMIRIDDEIMVVSAINATTNVLTLYARPHSGSTKATHAATSTVQIVGMARLEGDDADYGPIQDITAPYNYTQIFQKGINVTRTQAKISQWGIDDEFQYQENKAVPELMRLVERAMFNSVRAIGTKVLPRSFGGLDTFITDNTTNITTTLTKAAIESVAKNIWDDGGNVDMLVVGSGGANTLHGLLDTSSFIRITQENTIFGMRPVARLNTQFFTDVELVVSRWIPANAAYLLNSSKVGFYTFDPFKSYEVARTGDSLKGEVIAELSLLLANDKSHGWIKTSAASL